MNLYLLACFFILGVALVISLYDKSGFYKFSLSVMIVLLATFILYFSIEQSARDAVVSELRPVYIKTEFGAGVYAMKVAIGPERACLFVLIVALAVMSVLGAKK